MHAFSHPTKKRGQSALETALFVIVFIPILMFGIHFAEVGFLSLKVTEAANFATFDMPFGRKLHDAAANQYGITNFAAAEGTSASGRYASFDGRKGSPRAPGTTQVFTRGAQLAVACSGGGAVKGLVPSGGSLGTNGQSAVSCSAEAVLSSFNIPTHFMEKGGGHGTSTVALDSASDQNLHVCAIGFYEAGGCKGRLALLLDDWGLTGSNEGMENRLGTSANPGFYGAASRMYFSGAASGEQGAAFARGMFVPAAANEDGFYLSFRGSESGYQEQLPGGSHYPNDTWWTTPSYDPGGTPYTSGAHGGCFAGLACGRFN